MDQYSGEELEKRVYDRLVRDLGRKFAPNIVPGVLHGWCDISIVADDQIKAAIEVKRHLTPQVLRQIDLYLDRCASHGVNILYLVFARDNIVLRYDIYSQQYTNTEIPWHRMVSEIREMLGADSPAPEDIAQELAAWITELCAQRGYQFQLDPKNLTVNSSNVTLDCEAENNLFRAILQGKNPELPDRVCRYTSISSMMFCVNLCQQNMLSIVCMNDKSECYYADDYLTKDKIIKPGAKRREWYDGTLQTIEDTTESYILSLNSGDNCDDLTLWRLYGDDAKGACISYTVPEKFPNSFYLAPVSYGGKDGVHPELDFIKVLQSGHRGYELWLGQWNVWKHFFKPWEYAIEREIRLLYIPPKDDNSKKTSKWIVSNSNNIITPMKVFSIKPEDDAFPLTLCAVTLGPKAKEAKVNRSTLQYLAAINFGVDAQNDPNVKVSNSKIDSYRD